MNNFGEGHPCAGKDCIKCDTCIFDRNIFENGITPNESLKKIEEDKRKNMNNERLCNNCVNLSRSYSNCYEGRYDASCKVATYEAFGTTRPRRIDSNLTPNQTIISPNWCPLKSSNAQLCLPVLSKQTNPIPSSTTPKTPNTAEHVSTYTSQNDRREKMKLLKRHLEWADIQEGKMYVIPKILSQSRKIVKVITKTDMSCICHEISEYTGNEYTYNCTVYPSDLDAVFITELHNF